MTMDWPTASVVCGVILMLGQLLRDFLMGKYHKDNRDSETKKELRVDDEKWKTSIFVQLAKLQEGQDNLRETINRFKDDVQNDVNILTARIDAVKVNH